MAIVLGVDGCPGGWCAVTLNTESGDFRASHIPEFPDLLSNEATIIAIDIPIGLAEAPGGRDCDRYARAVLGWPRRNSVFSPPARSTLAVCHGQDGYTAACSENHRVTGRKISRQSYGIAPKIREVDEAMTPDLECRVYEVHPEVSFAALAGAPLKYRKSTLAGRLERWRILRNVFPQLVTEPAKPVELAGARCALEDYIDALVCAWTAARIAENRCLPLPDPPPIDPRGLRMAIWQPLP